MVIKLGKKNKKNKFEKNTISTYKLRFTLSTILICFILLIIRLIYLQLIDGDHLSTLASNQQTKSEIINGKRGNIYDATGVSLAISEPVDTITVNPSKLAKKEKIDDDKLQKLVATGLSEIFELDYNETLEKIQSKSSVVTIAQKVEEDKVNELKNWMKENKIKSGINIDEDTKRYYPYNTLAAQVIGVCGTDNQGLSGIEYSYDSILKGT